MSTPSDVKWLGGAGRKGVIAAAILVLLLLGVAQRVKFSGPIAFEISDSKTGLPLEGVVIVVDWVTVVGHEVPNSIVKIEETVTGPDGTARVPGWGPRFIGLSGHLTRRQPSIKIVKRGYEPLVLVGFGNSVGGLVDSFSATSRVGHQVARRLKRVTADARGYRTSLDSLAVSLDLVYSGFSCAWHETPRLISELERIRSDLDEIEVRNILLPVRALGNQQNCGDPVVILEAADR